VGGSVVFVVVVAAAVAETRMIQLLQQITPASFQRYCQSIQQRSAKQSAVLLS